MEAENLIARLTPVTSDFERVGVSSVPGLDAMDAARALAGLDRGPYLLAMVVLAQDASSLKPLELQLWGEMCGVATRKNWIVPVGDELLRRMSCLAVGEVVSPKVCGRCSGRGTIYPRGAAARTCDACGGGGRGKVTGRDRARSLGICKSSWSRTWGLRYGEFVGRLSGWERAIHAHVRLRLGFRDACF